MNSRRGSQLVIGGVAIAALVLVVIMFVTRPGTSPGQMTDAPTPTRLPVSAAVSPLTTPAARAAAAGAPAVEPTAAPTEAAAAAPTAIPTEEPPVATTTASASIPVYTPVIVAEYPHDPDAFTQGLQFVDGELYEGTGLRGRSSLRRVDLETGKVLQQIDLDRQYFGEGIGVIGDRIYQLTWQSQVAFLYDKTTFAEVGRFDYPTEGWGLTFDGTELIMSDGTATLYRRDPETFAEISHVDVQADGDLVPHLNELEFVNGEIFANIWQTNVIARIDPNDGQVVGWVDLSSLLKLLVSSQPVDVLNGIAYDATADRLFVTGKLWPTLFEITLELQAP